MDPFQKKVDIEVNDIQEAINKNIARPSKPVKFTWKGQLILISASNTPLGNIIYQHY